MRNRRVIWAVLMTAALFLILPLESCGTDNTSKDEKYYHELGLKLYYDGFYELLPKGKVAEAKQKFEQAADAFKEAVLINDKFIDSHKYLAKIYAMQENYLKAIDEHLKVIELDPDNLDNYLLLASVYVRTKRFNEAEKVMEHAKTKTKDPMAIQRVNELIKNIREKSLK